MASEDPVLFSDLLKFTTDIGSLYLNSQFSDIKILVAGETLPAHSVILAVRSNSLAEAIRAKPTAIAIEGDSSQAFKVILKYIYTGSVRLGDGDVKTYSEVLKLAQRYAFDEFKAPISAKLRSLVRFPSVYGVLNEANVYGFEAVRDDCHQFIENHGAEFAADDDVVKLSQKSMVNLLTRDKLLLPEVALFKIVLKWRKANVDFDDLVLKSVQYARMNVTDVISTVWPSKTLKCEDLFDALAQIADLKPKTAKFKPIDVNVATPELGARVLTGHNGSLLINGNNVLEIWTTISLGDRNGCIIELGRPYVLNYFRMRLYDADNRFYQYYIEISMDKSKWKKVIDYSAFPARSLQHLYFAPEQMKFVRIVGIESSLRHISATFHLIFFEAYRKSTIPEGVNGVRRPLTNVATRALNAIVISGIKGSALVNGNYTNYNSTHGFASQKIGAAPLIVQLAQPYLISSLKLLLLDTDARTYSFYVETSTNRAKWEMAVDRRGVKSTGWQEASFVERTVVFLRITGTFTSKGDGHIHCVHLECPAPLAL